MDYEATSHLAEDFGGYLPGTRMPYDLTQKEKEIMGPPPRGNDQTGITRSIAFSLADIDSEIAPKPKTSEPPRRTYSQDGFIGFRIFNLEF